MSVDIQGHRVKLKNRRVFLGRSDDMPGHWFLKFKSLKNGRKVNKTEVILSNEAMDVLVGLYFYIKNSEE